MNMKIYKKKKSHKELGRFTQNRYIRIVDILPIWNDMRIVDMTKLGDILLGGYMVEKVGDGGNAFQSIQ